jgi:hypothetical protein
LLAVTGSLIVLIFLSQIVIALVQLSPGAPASNLALSSMVPTDFRVWIAAGETAAWRLKWVMIPISLLVLFGSRKLYRSTVVAPERFCAQRYARNGYFASAAVPLLVLILIGVTVPARLRHRQWGVEAGFHAQAYRIDRALVEYREAFGTLPSDLKDLSRLPDADGSIAAVIQNVDTNGYTVDSEVAAVPTKKPRPLRGAVILNASVNTTSDEPLSGGISFTNYELRLPGFDKVLGNDDDLVLHDGVVDRLSDLPQRGSRTASTTPKRQP